MRLLQHNKPELKIPEFVVDEPLTKRPEVADDPLLKHLNKSFCWGLVSKAGGGKTSFLISLLNQRGKYLNKVFNKIYVFMPNSSRASMKKNIFEHLPEDQLYEGVNFENLSEVYEKLLENTENKKKSLLIFDDVQSYLKAREVEVNLLHIIANRRHLRTSVAVILQQYVKCPLDIRKSFTALSVWNVNKEEWDYIYQENIGITKKDFKDVIIEFNKTKRDEPKSFIFIADQTNIFINWNEALFEDENNETL
jgi:hypothetical protein